MEYAPQTFVILFFPNGFRGEPFASFNTKDLYYQGQLEPAKLINLYVEEVGFQPAYAVALFNSEDELMRNFSRTVQDFANYIGFPLNQDKFVVLYFPEDGQEVSFLFGTFNIRNNNYKGIVERAKWIEMWVMPFGWRRCFVVGVYNSEEELTQNYARVTEEFCRVLEYSLAHAKYWNLEMNNFHPSHPSMNIERRILPKVDTVPTAQIPPTTTSVSTEMKKRDIMNQQVLRAEAFARASNPNYLVLDNDVLQKELGILQRYHRKYSLVVRQLLRLHFSPEELMTHSLAGKCGYSFKGKHSAKPVLKSSIVNHIIEIAMNHFTVTRNMVRHVITAALADARKPKLNKREIMNPNIEYQIPKVDWGRSC